MLLPVFNSDSNVVTLTNATRTNCLGYENSFVHVVTLSEVNTGSPVDEVFLVNSMRRKLRSHGKPNAKTKKEAHN